MPKFNWDEQPDAKPVAAKKSGKFSWDDQEDAMPDNPEEPGIGQQLLNGLVTVGKTIDSYTGAPTRAAISSLQDDVTKPGRALGAFAHQFGEDPEQAPSGKDIARKAGVPDTALSQVAPRLYSESGDGLALKRGGFFDPTASGAAGLGIDIAADPTNFIPVGLIAKGATKGAANAISKGVNLTADALKGSGEVAASVGKKAIQGVFGVPEEAINRYLARHPQLKDKVGAREMMEELAGKLDEGLKPARAELSAAEEAVQKAKSSRSEDLAELQIKRQEAAEALRRAEDNALGEASSRLSSRVQQLDEKVSAGSSKAFDILDKEGAVVPTQQLKSRMTAGIKALEERAVTDEQSAVVDLLKRYRDRLDKFGSEIPGGEAKRILQSLDREIKFVAPGEIGRMSKPDQALGALRRHIDEPLKQSPSYAGQMAEVSRLMGILSDTKALASDSAAARALKAARGATGKDRAEAIQKVAAEFGDDFLAAADRRNLPEYHQLKAVLQRVRSVKKGQSVKDAASVLESAKSRYGDAVDLGKNGIAGITDKISATVRQANPKAVPLEELKKAGDLAGVKMADELADTRTIASFEKGYNRGSANTNFWGAVVGGLMGSALGPGGIAGGAAAGGALGRIVIDNFGPRVGRIILDQVPLLKKVQPSEWIRSLDVPPAVKLKLAEDLNVYKQVSQGAKGGYASVKPLRPTEMSKVAGEDQEADRAPAAKTGPDRWAQDGLKVLGIQDAETQRKLMQSNEGKRLLIEASSFKPGSPGAQRIMEKIKKGWGQ